DRFLDQVTRSVIFADQVPGVVLHAGCRETSQGERAAQPLLLAVAGDLSRDDVAYLLWTREIPKCMCSACEIRAPNLKIHSEPRVTRRPHNVDMVAFACPIRRLVDRWTGTGCGCHLEPMRVPSMVWCCG